MPSSIGNKQWAWNGGGSFNDLDSGLDEIPMVGGGTIDLESDGADYDLSSGDNPLRDGYSPRSWQSDRVSVLPNSRDTGGSLIGRGEGSIDTGSGAKAQAKTASSNTPQGEAGNARYTMDLSKFGGGIYAKPGETTEDMLRRLLSQATRVTGRANWDGVQQTRVT